MDDACDLREANGLLDRHCDGSSCVFWRVVEQIGDAPGDGCAIKHYQLLGDEGVAAWLLSVKERLERDDPSALGRLREATNSAEEGACSEGGA